MNGAAVRGQPLLVFAAILGLWMIGRVMLWESPFPALAGSPQRYLAEESRTDRPPAIAGAAVADAAGPVEGSARLAPNRALAPEAAILLAPPIYLADPVVSLPEPAIAPPPAPFALGPVRRAAGHNLLLAAAFAHMALPPEVARFYAGDGSPRPAAAVATAARADRPLLGGGGGQGRSRWSADGWLMWREGSSLALTRGAPSYGRSQAGAVVRYRLARGGMQPQAHARVTRSVEGPREAELAAGLSLRPLARVPVRIAAEGRVHDTSAGREVRPAVVAVTELPPAELGAKLRAEAYAQGGWVGGDYATGFIDGQARIDRAVLSADGVDLRAGVATWGGAQKGLARLDVGPSATVAVRLGDVRTRLAVDYRVRVAGDAAPASGLAVTFSAGF